jgi:hypothetical protein
MGLADELKALQELHEKGQLSDQEYADAKAAVLKGQASSHTQTSEVVGGTQGQERKSPGCLTMFAVISGALVVLIMIVLASLPHSETGTSGGSSTSTMTATDASSVQRPAVLVRLKAASSGNPEEDLGARDYLDATASKNLSGVVGGLNALCSGFHFYSGVSKPDYTVVFVVKDIDRIGLGVWKDGNGKEIGTRVATSINSAYFTACGLLRQHAPGRSKP